MIYAPKDKWMGFVGSVLGGAILVAFCISHICKPAFAGLPCSEPNRPAEIVEWEGPDFPSEAWRQGWEGTVVIGVFITEADTISEAWIAESSGHSILDEAALESTIKARFRAPVEYCVPYGTKIEIPWRFRINVEN